MGETVAQYEAALQELATKCEFKDSSDAIKDQFLSGILSDDIRETLFKLENLTLELALKTATACEEAKVASSKVKANGEQSENKQDLLQLKSEIFRGSANKRFNHKRGSTFHQNKGKFQGKNSSRYQQRNKNNTRNNSNSNCHRCGKPNHEESRCWHKDKTCNKCNKKGHLESVCWSGGKNQATLKNLQEKKEDKQSSTDDESWFDDFFRISVSDPVMKINSLEKKEKIDPQYLNVKVDWKIVSRETRKDLVLAKVMNYVKYGWPKGKLPDEITPFLNRKDELTIEQDCILWGYRVIIPGKMINTILNELHKTHLGIVKMKAVARSFFWWPGIDACIERTAKACDECARERDNPPASYLNPWKWPCGVWVRIHSDLIGPIDGLTFLLILDARSKWPEIFLMPNTTSESLIKMFRQVFARFGFPECLITDNGPQYTALEFKLFVKKSGIKHVKSAVKHPETNGAAENLVRTFKKAYKKLKRQGLSTQKAIDTFLFDYRTTKHCTTGETPAKLMLGKELRTRFTLLLPNTEQKVNEKHDCQIQHKRGKRIIEFKEGDLVWAMNFSKNAAPWLEAKIKSRIGPVNYLIEWESGKVDKRHVDQIVTRETVELDDVAQTNEKANVEKTVLLRRSARLLEREQKLSGEKV
ncbi:uncharacterized protein K02A2.6-like [Neodiprion virginianus]|uniref:uncharacterized protein K02A2.6-like n=1 Tax=Neodiprion virginianus TaxID=2961670 RepID=UPI001EE6CE21|nr:uncharacterized protein K02A2.6-like [Neodiprion virginianus]